MSSRPLIIASLLGASVGVPYLASHSSKDGKGISNLWQSATSASQPAAISPGAPPALSAPLHPTMQSSTGARISGIAPLEGTRFQSVDQVLRFDVTKDWVYRNWARKSTGPTDVGLFSVRVPLVMGSPVTGLAGSLTYFFNAQDQVEHISFRGRTGDTSQLVQFLMRSYQFIPVPGQVGEQLYQVGSGDQVQSELRTHPEGVLWSSSPQTSVAVQLELARPGSKRFLPPKPTGLQIPPVAAQPSSAPANAGAANQGLGASVNSAVGSYFGKGRYATPVEEGQVLWKRWPN